mgnify:FL=1
MEKGYITILDFEKGKVFQYELVDRNMQCEECEQFIEDKGHNVTNCEWMVTKTNEVIRFDLSDDVFDYGYKRNLDRYDINNDGTREICG